MPRHHFRKVFPLRGPAQQIAIAEPMVRRLVWEFFCQVVFWFVAGSLFGAGRPFLVPSPAIRFAERAEGVKGPKR